jgi:hypothetical protein
MLQRISSALVQSQNSMASSSQPLQSSSSSSLQESSQSDTVKAQLAARRARMEAAKLQHGIPPLSSRCNLIM